MDLFGKLSTWYERALTVSVARFLDFVGGETFLLNLFVRIWLGVNKEQTLYFPEQIDVFRFNTFHS